MLPIITSRDMDLDDIAVQFNDMQTNESEDTPESIISFTSETTVDVYNQRMKDIFEDMFDLGYI
jgi:hypothetical protein